MAVVYPSSSVTKNYFLDMFFDRICGELYLDENHLVACRW
jgi:hypothetical protein